MRFIPTKVHGVMDYAGGLILILAPWLLGFAGDGAESWVPVVIGIAMIGMSAFTDYELGLLRALPVSTHLIVDFCAGAFLAASPWLFGFADAVWIPHVVLGIAEMGAALTTELQPSAG